MLIHTMLQIDLIRTPGPWFLCIAGLIWILYKRFIARKSEKQPSPLANTSDTKLQEDAYFQINALPDLNIENEEPIKLRPFKPRYHLTMSIENSTLSDLIAMDKTYASRIALRSRLIREEGENVLAMNPIVDPAVNEFYEWMIETYLPKRFPSIYTLSPTGLYNSVTQTTIPLHPPSAKAALEILGSNVDCDFLFLLPPSCPEDDDKYRLQGFVTCFPSGFATRKKLGLKLAEIHTPVPNYSAKLEKSMDRFFATLPIGKIVKRANWTITTHNDLYCLSGNHISDAERQALEEGRVVEADFDIEQTVLRCERQTLHRMPRTKALVFAFKTYQYPIRELREEGYGEELAGAIDGLGAGNVPEMKVYKKAALWGERVKKFLREGI